ncbi:hypothetical protein [uncultured Gammaproteobacteria bacterium]|nr:hypothetical protein [uncultured Gammaproteobacteria bacterium]
MQTQNFKVEIKSMKTLQVKLLDVLEIVELFGRKWSIVRH